MHQCVNESFTFVVPSFLYSIPKLNLRVLVSFASGKTFLELQVSGATFTIRLFLLLLLILTPLLILAPLLQLFLYYSAITTASTTTTTSSQDVDLNKQRSAPHAYKNMWSAPLDFQSQAVGQNILGVAQPEIFHFAPPKKRTEKMVRGSRPVF